MNMVITQGSRSGATQYWVKMEVPMASLFSPATSHMTMMLFAVGVQETTRATSQKASAMVSSRCTKQENTDTIPAVRTRERTDTLRGGAASHLRQGRA